jgi:hypothetical protein
MCIFRSAFDHPPRAYPKEKCDWHGFIGWRSEAPEGAREEIRFRRSVGVYRKFLLAGADWIGSGKESVRSVLCMNYEGVNEVISPSLCLIRLRYVGVRFSPLLTEKNACTAWARNYSVGD